MSQAGDAVRFVTQLYADEARRLYLARFRGDLPARLAGRAAAVDPYPLYEQFRSHGPFIRNRFGHLLTTDYAICDEVLRSRRFGPRPEQPPYDPTVRADAEATMLGLNPPDHTRLRRIASPAFDLVSGLAAPLPISVITTMLDIPAEHQVNFVRYGQVIGGALSGIRNLRHAIALQQADKALNAIFADLIEQRRRSPGQEVVSRIVAAEGDQQIHPAEMAPMCQLLLIAGFETTVNALGNGIVAFSRHPDQWERLVADPTLAAAATEEVLRYDSSVQRTARVSFDDTEIAGQPIKAGEFVQPIIGGANRDPARFADPATFDIGRPNASEHLSFSGGIHYCLGQPLARLELTAAFEVLATRLPRLRVVGTPRYRPSSLLRGPLRLPVAA